MNPVVPQVVTNSFLQYGVLGAVALLLGFFAWTQYKRLVEKNDKLEQKVDRLQQEMMEILVEERDRMSKLITDNTIALQELQKTIVTYIVATAKNSQNNSL
jgi:mannitol-1-phosphate/altronate dehydrogenase